MLDEVVHAQAVELRVVLLQVRLARLRARPDGLRHVLVVVARGVRLVQVRARLVVRRDLRGVWGMWRRRWCQMKNVGLGCMDGRTRYRRAGRGRDDGIDQSVDRTPAPQSITQSLNLPRYHATHQEADAVGAAHVGLGAALVLVRHVHHQAARLQRAPVHVLVVERLRAHVPGLGYELFG